MSRPEPLEGHLKKLGEKGIQTFKKRYFRQQGYQLLYFKSSKDALSQHLGFIDLTSIIGLSLSNKQKDTFIIETKDRSYTLQVYEGSGLNVNYWIEGIQEWMRWLNKEQFRKQKIASKTEEVPVSDTIVMSQPKDLVLEREDITEKLENTELSIDKEDEEINKLADRLNTLNDQWRKLQYSKSDIIELEKQSLLSELEKNKEILAEGDAQLKTSDNELIQSENETDKANVKLVLEVESLLYRQSLLENLNDVLKSMEEASEKKKSFIQNKKLRIQNNDPSSLGEEYNTLREVMNDTVQQQNENEKLYRLLKRNEANHKSRLVAMNTTIETLKTDLEAKKNAFEVFRDEVAKVYAVDKRIFDEHEELRKQYFYTTAVSVKLQGEISGLTPKPLNLQDLYTLAQAEHSDYKEWHDFILENLFPTRQRQSSV